MEAVGCLVGTEAAGGTPPSRLGLICDLHRDTHTCTERDTRSLKDSDVGSASPMVMNPGPYGRTGVTAREASLVVVVGEGESGDFFLFSDLFEHNKIEILGNFIVG